MTKKKDLKRRVRERASKTGESYAAARSQVLQSREAPAKTAPPAARRTIFEEQMFDLSTIPDELREGSVLGLKCAVIPTVGLHKEGLARRALEGFKAALEALAGDHAAVILRQLAFDGTRPPAPLAAARAPSAGLGPARTAFSELARTWRLFGAIDNFALGGEPFRGAVALFDRLEAGLVGLGPDGRSLAFMVDGRCVIAACTERDDATTAIQLELKETWASRVAFMRKIWSSAPGR